MYTSVFTYSNCSTVHHFKCIKNASLSDTIDDNFVLFAHTRQHASYTSIVLSEVAKVYCVCIEPALSVFQARFTTLLGFTEISCISEGKDPEDELDVREK